MKLGAVVVSALVSLTRAHDDPREIHAGVPKLLGARQFLSELKARNALPDAFAVPTEHIEERQLLSDETVDTLEARQNSNGRCGPGLGTCATTECCSPAG